MLLASIVWHVGDLERPIGDGRPRWAGLPCALFC